jgi:hypothetical protein
MRIEIRWEGDVQCSCSLVPCLLFRQKRAEESRGDEKEDLIVRDMQYIALALGLKKTIEETLDQKLVVVSSNLI